MQLLIKLNFLKLQYLPPEKKQLKLKHSNEKLQWSSPTFAHNPKNKNKNKKCKKSKNAKEIAL